MQGSKTISSQSYCSTEGVMWVNDAGRLLVVDEHKQKAHLLHDEEAALWRWLHQGFSHPEILTLFCALTNTPTGQGEIQMRKILQDWVEYGLLEARSG